MEVGQQTDFPVDRMGDGSAVVGIGLAVTGTEGEYLFTSLPLQSQVIVNAAYVDFLLQRCNVIIRVLDFLQTHFLLYSIG